MVEDVRERVYQWSIRVGVCCRHRYDYDYPWRKSPNVMTTIRPSERNINLVVA